MAINEINANKRYKVIYWQLQNSNISYQQMHQLKADRNTGVFHEHMFLTRKNGSPQSASIWGLL